MGPNCGVGRRDACLVLAKGAARESTPAPAALGASGRKWTKPCPLASQSVYMQPLDPVIKEEAELDVAEQAEIVPAVEAISPAGWRIDRFGSREVHTPPWSRRPPSMEPEVWV